MAELKLNLETRGRPGDPAVVLLHGLLGASRNLRRLSDAIVAQGFYVIAYDQRGHGHSGWADDYSLELMAADAVSVLDQHQITHAHFVGHSMGGRVSLAVSGQAPERQRSLTMLDVGPRISQEALNDLKSVLDPLPPSYASRGEAEASLNDHDWAMKQFLLSNLRSAGSGLEVRWVFDLEGLRNALLSNIQIDQSDLLRRITIPTLMLRGDLSRHFNANELEQARSLNPRIEVQTIPRAGHWLHVDNFADTAAAVIGWLNSLK